MLVFKGIQKTTLIDFPGKLACTLFLPKCDFRCPFCYNKQLVLDQDTGIEITEKHMLKFLDERKGFLEGVCITGGEPLLHPGLLKFLEKLKGQGFLTKLDTNGSRPEALAKILGKKAVDYVAMDVKASKGNYDRAAGTKVNLKAIEESIGLIKEKAADYEFRTTVVPVLHSEKDILQIGNWLKGSKRFFLQGFNSDPPLLDEALQGSKAYGEEELQHFAEILKPFFGEVKVRGL